MRKQYIIAVCSKGKNYGEPGKFIKTIRRVVWSEQIGNFSPIFCRYNKKRCLVQSKDGDLSDPFRREESYAKTFYIEMEG